MPDTMLKSEKSKEIGEFAEELANYAGNKLSDAPKGSEAIAQSLKALASGEPDIVEKAAKSLDDIDDWLITKNANGQSNYETLCKRFGKKNVNHIITLVSEKTGIEMDPADIEKGLRKLRKYDAPASSGKASSFEDVSGGTIHAASKGDGNEENFWKGDYLDPNNYVDQINDINQHPEFRTPEQSKREMLGAIAHFINAKICKMSNSQPSLEEFSASTKVMVESPAFIQTIEKNGGATLEGLEELQKKMLKDDGKTLFGDFMQNANHIKEKEAKNEAIKEEAAAKRQLEIEQPKADKVLGAMG